MIIYAHRGNLSGKSVYENEPAFLEEAIAAGFHVEVDLWRIDGVYFLGHDGPEHRVDLERFDREEVIFHLKNAHVPPLKHADAFAIDNDRYVLTLRGKLWTNYGQSANDLSIMCAPDLVGAHQPLEAFIGEIRAHALGICTDYPIRARGALAGA
jgi:hypothetical protein